MAVRVNALTQAGYATCMFALGCTSNPVSGAFRPAAAVAVNAAPTASPATTITLSAPDQRLDDKHVLLRPPASVTSVMQLGRQFPANGVADIVVARGFTIIAKFDGEAGHEVVDWANQQQVTLAIDCEKDPPAGLQRGFCRVSHSPTFLFTAKIAALQELSLSFDLVNDDDLQKLSALHNLTSIDLYAKQKITDRGLRGIAKLPNLRELNLQLTAVTGSGVRSLLPATALAYLNLSETKATGNAIATLQQLPNLRRLVINLEKGQSMAGLARLKAIEMISTYIESSSFDEFFAAVVDLKNLVEIDLRFTSPPSEASSDNAWANLARLRNLRVLALQLPQNANVNQVATLSRLPHLSELWLSGGTTDQLALLGQMSSLTSLDIRGLAGNPWTASAGFLAKMPALRTLYSSTISDTDFGTLCRLSKLAELMINVESNHVSAFGCIAQMSTLRSLRIDAKDLDEEFVVATAALKELRALNLSHVSASEAALKAIAGLHELRQLSLRQSTLAGSGLLKLAQLEHLDTLDLSNSTLTGVGLQQLPTLPSLRTLYLVAVKLGSGGATAIAKQSTLRDLILYQSNLDDDGLTALTSMTSLQVLVVDNSKVTSEGLSTFQRARPTVKMSH
jgi:hypothetical protein